MATKTCIRCGVEKALEEFHRHAKMKDGRLNKCRACALTAVREWRTANPDARKAEHRRHADRVGIIPAAEYHRLRAETALGRKATSLRHAHKRNAQKRRAPTWDAELDDFVVEMAMRLIKQRTEMIGGQWQLDHIVPLNHAAASGLHNAHNLQVVPARWNRSKSNKSMAVWRP
jgi:hypothetical protein